MFHLNFLYIAVSWVLLRWHDLFTLIGFSDSSGWGWTLSIIFLVITARLLLFRVFVRQVHSMRNMQRMQPKIQKLREKYKNDKPELNRQMMALQQEEGFNPISGCLPMVLQIPVFIGLFHTLRHLSNSVRFCSGGTPRTGLSEKASDLLSLYTFDKAETCHAASAKILGAPLAASFHDKGSLIHALGGQTAQTKILIFILLIISAGATFATQLLTRANATTVPEGQAATIQKVMLYVIPIGVLASGLLFNFPLGVLLYWFTSNLWTLGQQAYIIRYHPPEQESVAAVGELGKTLAPKAGQRPTRDRRAPNRSGSSTGSAGSGANGSNGSVDMAKGGGSSSAGKSHNAVAGAGTGKSSASGGAKSGTAASRAGATSPKVGQKPDRPGASRPSGKRPTKSKKRR